MDESPKQLIEVVSSISIKPRRVAKVGCEYIMCGMVSEPLQGKRIANLAKNKKKPDWGHFMKVSTLNRPGYYEIVVRLFTPRNIFLG